MNNRKIVYIAGEGHSGSTLLAILLGDQKEAFCAGELTNLPEKGIQNQEYCSCGEQVPNCKVWENIIREWNRKRILDLETYIQLQKKLISNKNLISSHRKLRTPSGEVAQFLKDTSELYRIIFDQTASNIIIDSSKSPNKIPILNKLEFDISVVHLIRRFGDVLNSYKYSAEKNLEAGIEHEITPKKTSYVFRSWILKNILTLIFSRNLDYKKIKYEQIVNDPLKYINKLVPQDVAYAEKLKHRGPFVPRHLVAGNRLRMKEEIFISERPMGSNYTRLNKVNRMLASCMDFFYKLPAND